jgi:indole-3-glycerol phosphate synthase
MILDEILANKRVEVEARKTSRPQVSLEQSIHGAPRDFVLALRAPGVSVIAEIKRRSPSGGELRPDLSVDELASRYAHNGAAALSVLTDARYFGGGDADLLAARQTSGLPVLRKDFLLDSYQLYESRALGADAVLLIVRALDQPRLVDLLALAGELGLAALVETHSAAEVERALAAGARVVGVNNRDLDTLVTDSSLALRLRRLVPEDRVFVAESGISRPEQIAELAAAGVDAVLIGEALLRAPDPGMMLASFASPSGRGRRAAGEPGEGCAAAEPQSHGSASAHTQPSPAPRGRSARPRPKGEVR